MKIFANKGARITCDVNGHLIATFARDVNVHEIIETDMFNDRHIQMDWRKNAILNGRCPEPGCEGVWWSDEGKMFVDGEWR